jgi:hypothetical protein
MAFPGLLCGFCSSMYSSVEGCIFFLSIEPDKRSPIFYVIGEGGGRVRDSLLATEANLRDSDHRRWPTGRTPPPLAAAPPRRTTARRCSTVGSSSRASALVSHPRHSLHPSLSTRVSLGLGGVRFLYQSRRL